PHWLTLRSVCAGAHRGTELRVVAQQETAGTLGATQPANGFAVAGRGEVQQGKTLEEYRVVHGGVERAHESLGGVEFARGRLGILREGAGNGGRRPGRVARLDQ